MGFLSALLGKTDKSQLIETIKEGVFYSESVNDAINIPLDSLYIQLVKLKGKKNIIAFCQSGRRSSQSKSILQKNIFEHMINNGSWQNVKEVINA